MLRRLSRSALLIVTLILALSQAGCRQSGPGKKDSGAITGPGEYANLVINDFPVPEDQYRIETKNKLVHILLNSDIITSALKLPYATDTYPELSTENGQITMSWKDHGRVVLKVDMVEGSHEAYINDSNEPLDIIVAPETVGGRLFIPVNLLLSALNMKETYDRSLGVTFLHYAESLPEGLVHGSWSDTGIDIFAGSGDIPAGLKTPSSLAVGYEFKNDGRYRLTMIFTGDFYNEAVKYSGKYKILGNTLIYYDILETVYEGRSFQLIHKDKKLGKLGFEFIGDYSAGKDEIELGGLRLHKVNP